MQPGDPRATLQVRTGIAYSEERECYFVMQETLTFGIRASIEVVAGPFDTDDEALDACAGITAATRRDVTEISEAIGDAHVEPGPLSAEAREDVDFLRRMREQRGQTGPRDH